MLGLGGAQGIGARTALQVWNQMLLAVQRASGCSAKLGSVLFKYSTDLSVWRRAGCICFCVLGSGWQEACNGHHWFRMHVEGQAGLALVCLWLDSTGVVGPCA